MSEIKKYSKKWRLKNPKKVKEIENQWLENIFGNNFSEHIKEYRKVIIEGNKKYNKSYRRICEKYKNDLKYNLNCRMSGMMRYSLKRNKKGNSWTKFVDYNISALIERLKKTMPKEHTWRDFLEGKLHIDHIIPITAFNFTKSSQIDFQRCWALNNLQLLPAKENLSKNNKLVESFQPCLRIGIN